MPEPVQVPADGQATDGLSFDVNAELAKLQGGTSGDTGDTGDTGDEGSVEGEDNTIETDLTSGEDSSFFSKKDGDDTDASTQEDDSVLAEGLEPYVFKDDGQEVSLHPVKDAEEIRRRLAMYGAGKKTFSQNAKLKQENRKQAAALKAAAADREKAQLVDDMQKHRGNPYAMMKILSGGKIDFREAVKAEAAKQIKYAQADDAGKAAMDKAEENETLRRELEDIRVAAQNERDVAAAERSRGEQAELRSRAIPYWKQVVSKLGIEDPVVRNKTAKVIWQSAWDELTEQVDHPSEITNEMIKREMISTARLMGLSSKRQAETKVNDVVAKKKADAKAKAGVAATRHYKAPDLAKEVAGMDPMEAYRHMEKKGFFRNR